MSIGKRCRASDSRRQLGFHRYDCRSGCCRPLHRLRHYRIHRLEVRRAKVRLIGFCLVFEFRPIINCVGLDLFIFNPSYNTFLISLGSHSPRCKPISGRRRRRRRLQVGIYFRWMQLPDVFLSNKNSGARVGVES